MAINTDNSLKNEASACDQVCVKLNKFWLAFHNIR